MSTISTPAITETAPLANPASDSATAAPNANDTSTVSMPLLVSATPTWPSPPRAAMVSRNGASRVEKSKRTLSGWSVNGRLTLTPSVRFIITKTPAVTDGIGTE